MDFFHALGELTAKDDSRGDSNVENASPDSAIGTDTKSPISEANKDDSGDDILLEALAVAHESTPKPVTYVQSVPRPLVRQVSSVGATSVIRLASSANGQINIPSSTGTPRIITVARVANAQSFDRKRPAEEAKHAPAVKIFRTSAGALGDGRLKLESLSDTRFSSRPFSAQRVPMNFSLNYAALKRDEEMEEEDNADLAQAETYAVYAPEKLRVGMPHPDSIVESSTLSSVSPPDITYRYHLPDEVINTGRLSALQLEAVIYASQRHECILPNKQRAGFLIGDGAGVGKGRTIAALVYENYMQHRKKAVWLSVSNDLRFDAERDLADVGLGRVKVHPLNKLKYAKISGKENGCIKKGVLFSTYSSLIGESQGSAKAKYKTRLKQIVHWCGKDFDGLIIFDECHRAKNLIPSGSQKPTKTGLTVLELQNRLPNARIVYASATGATEPRNMAYMVRLGLWGEGTPFNEFNSFIHFVESRGVGGMELVAMDMKLRGMYIARQLSFHGVKFSIRPVAIENVTINKESFVNVYNQSADLWCHAYQFFSEAARLLNASDKYRKTMFGQIWSAHQRFFKYMCIAAKVDACVELCRKAIDSGKCVVIGLQSTGEAKTLEQVEETGCDLGDIVSTAKGVLQSLVEKYFPTSENLKNFETRGEKIANSERSSSAAMTASRTARAVASCKSSGIDLALFVGEKVLNKAIGSGHLTSHDGGNDDDSDGSDNGQGKNKDSDESEDDDGSESDSKVSCSAESDYLDSDLEIESSGVRSRSFRKKPIKKPKGAPAISRNKRKQSYDSDVMAGESDDDDEDYEALCDAFLMRQQQMAKNNDSLWADDSTRKLSAKYLYGSKPDESNVFGSSSAESVLSQEVKTRCDEMRNLLLRNIERLSRYLPPSSLDDLIEKLGGSSKVAEMTGRRGRVVNENGRFLYESRRELDCALERINVQEKERFMNGDKLIAIVSEAASSGISLQADRRAANQRRRVHITLELPWSADRAIQQFGRTHRSNQVSSPEYIFLISDLAGEQRFASTVAKRLESLGALTHGDRRATETRDLSRFNIDTKWGRDALDIVLKTFTSNEPGIVPPPASYHSDVDLEYDPAAINSLPPALRQHYQFFFDVKAGLEGVGLLNGRTREKDSRHISKFLNRILGLHVNAQNALFQYFSDTLEELMRRAKRDNRLDLGIMDLGSTGQDLCIVWTRKFDTHFLSVSTEVCLHKVTTQRGMHWNVAMQMYMEHDGDQDGFYLPKQGSGPHPMPLLAFYLRSKSDNSSGEVSSEPTNRSDRLYRVYRPNTGMQSTPMEYDKLVQEYTRVKNPDECKSSWVYIYRESETKCIHVITRNHCNRYNSRGGSCEVGLRQRTYYVLSGSVLNAWTHIEKVLTTRRSNSQALQVVRLKPKDGRRIVGVLIPPESVDAVLNRLSDPQSNLGVATSPLSTGPLTPSNSNIRSLSSPFAAPSNGNSLSGFVTPGQIPVGNHGIEHHQNAFENGVRGSLLKGVSPTSSGSYSNSRSFNVMPQGRRRGIPSARGRSRLDDAYVSPSPMSRPASSVIRNRVPPSIDNVRSSLAQKIASEHVFRRQQTPLGSRLTPGVGAPRRSINWVNVSDIQSGRPQPLPMLPYQQAVSTNAVPVQTHQNMQRPRSHLLQSQSVPSGLSSIVHRQPTPASSGANTATSSRPSGPIKFKVNWKGI